MQLLATDKQNRLKHVLKAVFLAACLFLSTHMYIFYFAAA